MDELTRKFFKEANAVRLQDDERADFRAQLQLHMEQHTALDSAEQKEAVVDDVTQAFFAEANAIHLEAKEHATFKTELQQFMGQQSVEALDAKTHHEIRRNVVDYMLGTRRNRDYTEKPASVFSMLTTILARTMITACAFILVGAGASYAAEGSIPGDALYPLKVKVLEPIQSSLTLSDESRAQWEATRAQRRLEEAEKLAANNALTEESWKELNTEFFLHVVQAEKHIKNIATTGQSDAASSLSADIDQYIQANSAVGKHLKKAEDAAHTIADDAHEVVDDVTKNLPVPAAAHHSSAATKKEEKSSTSKHSAKSASIADTVEEVIDDVLTIPAKIPVVFPSSKKQEQHSTANSAQAQSSLSIFSSAAQSSAISTQASSAISSIVSQEISDGVLDATDSLLPSLLD